MLLFWQNYHIYPKFSDTLFDWFSKQKKQARIISKGVSETWLRVDIQNVQNFKDWSDIAWDIQILIIGFRLQIQQNKDWVE